MAFKRWGEKKKKETHLQSVTHSGKHLHLAAVIVVQQNLCACLHHPKKIPIIGQMKHECSLPSPPADWGQAGPEVINSDISSLAVADCIWLHSTPPLLGLCSIPTPQVSNFDSLTTLISILESSVADIQFLCGENKGWQCRIVLLPNRCDMRESAGENGESSPLYKS